MIGVICPESRTDKRCFCLRLNSSPEMKRGLIIHKGENGLTLDYRSNLTVQAEYLESVPSDTSEAATRSEMRSENELIVNMVNRVLLLLLLDLDAGMMSPLPCVSDEEKISVKI